MASPPKVVDFSGGCHENLPVGTRSSTFRVPPASSLSSAAKAFATPDRVLTEDEIRAVWGTFDEELSPTMAAAFKVRLLTGQRGGEVLGMQWTHIDLDAESWEISGTLTKNGEVQRVPLVSATVAILREQRARVSDDVPWVFANEFGTGSVHHRAKKVAAQLSRALDFTFRGHDLRRTCATGMAEAGVPVDSITKVLSHVDRGARATRVYDRYSYDREKRAALDAWARRLDAILQRKRADTTVVPISHV